MLNIHVNKLFDNTNKHTHKIRLSKFNTMIEEVRSWEKKDEIHTHTHDISILQ